MQSVTKQQTATISLSMVGSLVTAVIAIWTFAAPIAQKAMAGEIQDQIAKQLAPIQMQISNQTAAQIVSLGATVKNLRASITALKFKKDMCSNVCWTLRDASDLEAAEIDLKAAEDALRLLRN